MALHSGMIVREILEEHSVQNHKVPWDSLCRLEVDLPQQHSLQAMVLVAKVGSHISAYRAREKQSEPEMVNAALRARAAALQASKKYEPADRAFEQWVDTHFVPQPAPR